ncbi:MAG: FAD-dependent oxidoreductase [Armatimonadetes bacterium]|nr:FAD-dependent oxidoreductase [Armatimonadota bacterium]
MAGEKCDILIVGGGTGGVAAAMMACDLGHHVILTEETDWVGGQLTSQIVPPDEHPWIEQFGCTYRYRTYRNRVRQYYSDHRRLTAATKKLVEFNPGGGWVSRLCHEPKVGHAVLESMLLPYVRSGLLTIRLGLKPHSAEVVGDEVRSVRFVNLATGGFELIDAKVFLDATELGDLLPMTKTEYVVGAESKVQTQEPNAVDGPAEPDNVQGITWCFALGYDENGDHRIAKPEQYEKWKDWGPDFWPGPLLGFQILNPHTLEVRELPLFGKDPSDWYSLFRYRQVVRPEIYENPDQYRPVTIANWPQNDYFEATITDVDPLPTGDLIPEGFEVPGAMGPVSASRLYDAKQLSLSVVYWLQNHAPRHDGQPGAYPGIFLDGGISDTSDGFAKYPYIRESRRIVAQYTVKEQDVAAYTNPNMDRAPSFDDSVGIGAYRIDLHPSTNGKNTIDTSTLPFEIPARSLIPVRMRNLIPACKNIGTTHITNGCYRLHPVEWNIGEAAGAMASLCVSHGEPVQAIVTKIEELQALLTSQGIEIRWPKLRAL